MFDKEIRSIESEILALKQQKEKMAQVMKTTSTTVSLTFELEIHNILGFDVVRSKKIAKVKIDTGDNLALLGVSYNIASLDSRTIRDMAYYDNGTGEIGRMVSIFSQNDTDLQTLIGGGSVILNYDMVITSTANFQVTVVYDDLWVD